jgi:exodeoxyribonuclease V alpha subunit
MLCRFDRAIFQSDNGYCVFSYSTQDESVPKEARKNTFFSDDKIHFTAVGYHLVSTNVVEVELDGTWEQSKHGLQLSVTLANRSCQRIKWCPGYLSSGIIKGVGPEIAKAIVAKFVIGR